MQKNAFPRMSQACSGMTFTYQIYQQLCSFLSLKLPYFGWGEKELESVCLLKKTTVQQFQMGNRQHVVGDGPLLAKPVWFSRETTNRRLEKWGEEIDVL